jgi:hypothetical protein
LRIIFFKDNIKSLWPDSILFEKKTITKFDTFITQVADGINKFACVPSQMGPRNKRRMGNASRQELRHQQIGHRHRNNNNKTGSNNQKSQNRGNSKLRTGNGHIPNGANAPSHAALGV